MEQEFQEAVHSYVVLGMEPREPEEQSVLLTVELAPLPELITSSFVVFFFNSVYILIAVPTSHSSLPFSSKSVKGLPPILFKSHYLCVCVCAHAHAWAPCVVIRGQLAGVDSHLPPCGFWELNLDCRAWQASIFTY